jgi:hypothetical protein
MYIDVVFHLQYKYANFSSLDHVHGGVGSVTFQLVKQCQDFSFGLFSGDILNVSSLMYQMPLANFLSDPDVYATC